MSLLDQPFLGHINDPEESDYSQIDLNEDLLKEHDSIELIRSISLRISESMLKFLLSNVDKNDIEFFTILLNRMTKVYSLNYLKLYKVMNMLKI